VSVADAKHVLELLGFLVVITLSWGAMRARVDEAIREARNAQHSAATAHCRLDQHREETVAMRLDIREMRTKLETLTDCVQLLHTKLDGAVQRMSDFQEALAAVRAAEKSE
jgi:hypothetical protein